MKNDSIYQKIVMNNVLSITKKHFQLQIYGSIN